MGWTDSRDENESPPSCWPNCGRICALSMSRCWYVQAIPMLNAKKRPVEAKSHAQRASLSSRVGAGCASNSMPAAPKGQAVRTNEACGTSRPASSETHPTRSRLPSAPASHGRRGARLARWTCTAGAGPAGNRRTGRVGAGPIGNPCTPDASQASPCSAGTPHARYSCAAHALGTQEGPARRMPGRAFWG